jgi:hypothetical protein
MSNRLHTPFDVDFAASSGLPGLRTAAARYVAAALTALEAGRVSPDRKPVSPWRSVSYGGENILELKG